MVTYGRFTPALVKSVLQDLSTNDLRTITTAAENFNVTGALVLTGVEVPKFNSTSPVWAATAATAIGATNMIAVTDGLGSAVPSLSGAASPTTSIALVWIKNTGDQLLYVYHAPADRMEAEPLASSATQYAVLASGHSIVLYVRVISQYLWHNPAFAGFLGLSASWNGDGSDDFVTTADVVALGLESFWAPGDY